MIYIIRYYRFDGKAEAEVFEGNYAIECNKVFYTDDYDYVYVEGKNKTEALVKARSVLREYFENRLFQMEQTFDKAIDEVKEFVVGDTVKVVRPGQQFTTHFEAMSGLLSNAFDFGYRGEFTVGGSITKYDLETTTFTVIGKGRFDANGGENMTLYMIAESVNAQQHDWHNNHDKTREPLEVFVLCKEGLEVGE